MRVLCRDAEWLVTRVESAGGGHSAVHCLGADDLVRGHQSIFLTQLDSPVPVDPNDTQLIPDDSAGYKMAKLFLEAQLRQTPATGVEPDLDGLGAFKVMDFQIDTVRHALTRLRPRLLLADDVGLGKNIQVGMIITELARRRRADRILVLTKKSMLTQFQAELWNRFNIPLVRLDSAGIAKLRLRIPANRNPFEVYHGKRETFGRLISLLPRHHTRSRDARMEGRRHQGLLLIRFKEDGRDQVGEDLPDRIVVQRRSIWDLLCGRLCTSLHGQDGSLTNERRAVHCRLCRPIEEKHVARVAGHTA